MPFEKSLLRECPTLRPSEEEFDSPIEYLSRCDIRSLGTEFGLVKIVPPAGWKPPFSLSQTFRFHTRTQKLGDLGITNRSRKCFAENMNRFMRMAGLGQKHPWITVKDTKVHVYDLYLAVQDLFLTETDLSSLAKEDVLKLNQRFGLYTYSKGLLNLYRDRVWPYAQFLANNGDNFDFPETLTDDPDSCVTCSKKHSPTTMLICDNCDDAFHTKCLSPALEEVPTGMWYCDKCLVGSGEYGFEENREQKFSLYDFVDDCLAFEKAFYEKFSSTNSSLSIDQLEQIFWRLVEEADDTIAVKYGADIHNQTVGEVSGFPTIDYPIDRTSEVEAYTRHPWNLTRLPFAKGSLLNHIKTKISGMTVPWLYVGSLLSTFCWHVEDHYTLSANYCHFGNVKNWYGIPSAYADKFEQHMRTLAPDLFKRQPDLLHQLVTLISPSELVKIGIPTVYARQGPNEFIVTFPRVYHAGFNCGLNFNEAVNFSMDSWLPFGEKSVEDYRIIKKESVFDHYTLVENILKSFVSGDVSTWFSHLDLVKQCLSSFAVFFNRQTKLVECLKSERLTEAHSLDSITEPITPKQEDVAVFEQHLGGDSLIDSKPKGMKAVANETEDKLCDICRTFLSFQYCNINNKLHRFGKWFRGRPRKSHDMLTPEATPYVLEHKQQSDEMALKMAACESSEKLQMISGIDDRSNDIKPESDLFNELILDAKRKLDQELRDVRSSKKQRTLRSQAATDSSNKRALRTEAIRRKAELVKEETPVPVVTSKKQERGLLRELNQFDNIRLCLQCTAEECGDQGERVPRYSEIIFEVEFNEMEKVMDEARSKLQRMAL